MRRVRVVMLLVSLGVLVPSVLLVRRALQGVEAERQTRHRAVAELLFDEMERQLAAFVQREEARPFAEYRRIYVPLNAADGAPGYSVSPLAGPPPDAFVLAYFQVEPDGQVTTPGQWTSPEAETDVTRWAKEGRASAARIEAQRGVGGDSLAAQAAGSTVPVQAKKQELAKESTDAQQSSELYRSFGKAATKDMQRAGRRQEQAPASNAWAFQNAQVESAIEPNLRLNQETFGQALTADKETQARAGAKAVGVTIDPLIGRRVDIRHLILRRSVVVNDQSYRQGLVVDLPRLSEFLASATLSGNQFAPYMSLRWDGDDVSPSADASRHVFQHRFLDPFDSLTATLSLRELPGPGGARYVLGLAGLLGVMAALGLVAVDRLVAVKVAFAERRSNFVSAVTHELKTPLTAIRMHAEMLRDGMVASDDKRQQYHQTITAEAERLTRLVDNVLELSRLERGSRPMNVVSGDVRPVLDEAAVVLGPHAARHGFSLRVEAEGDVPAARFDREVLLQVLTNLVDNAVKHARSADDKSIVLGCRVSGGRVVVCVRDHGPGVAAANVDRIFEPFYRGESEMTRRSPGTGIGLAIVKGLVERMGGVVAARNRDGGGLEVEVGLEVG